MHKYFESGLFFGAFIGGALLMGLVSYGFGFFDTIQEQITDRFFLTEEVSSSIVVVAIDEVSIEALGQWPWKRAEFADVLQELQGARLVGFDIIFSESSRWGEADDKRFSDALEGSVPRVVLPIVINEQSGLITRAMSDFDRYTESGFVNVTKERDGVLRYAETKRAGIESFDAVIVGGDQSSYPPEFRIEYRGPAGTYPALSFIDVLKGRVPPRVFEDRIVLIGVSAPGLGDIVETPFGAMPGVETRAHTIETLSGGEFFTDVSRMVGFVLIVLVVLLTSIVVLSLNRLVLLVPVLLLTVVGIMGGTLIAFAQKIIVPHLYLLFAFVVTAGLMLALKYMLESKEKRFIKKGFQYYVAPEVVDELYKSPEKLTLGGETRELTIFFSDIRGFTTLSEQLTPQELMQQLNEYLIEMTDIVMDSRGLVDKYIGDAVMAFWGAPLKDEQKEKHACESALLMFEALRALNLRWREEGRPEFAIGVGISTGDVVVGNMGSHRRFNYSIIGDEVNFSARLEGLTKPYGVECIIGSTTYEAIKDIEHLHARELDDVMVKGKKEPRKIFELLTRPMDTHQEEILRHFAEGKSRYQKGNWERAIASFEKAIECGDWGPSTAFLERTKELKANPPKDWDGVYTFTTK